MFCVSAGLSRFVVRVSSAQDYHDGSFTSTSLSVNTSVC